MRDRLDLDPPPSRSPRLYAEMEAVPRARPSKDLAGRGASEIRLRRLRLMAVVDACRSASPPVPYSTLAVTLKISARHAKRLRKAARKAVLRRSRV